MCKQNSYNSILGLVVSVIIGIGLSVLFTFSLIPNVIFALWIAFGLSVLSLIALLVLIPMVGFNNFSSLKKCVCANGRSLIIATLGTFITTLIALSLSLVVNTALIIIFFLIGTFFAFLLISIAQFLWCLINKDCCKCVPLCDD